jgi:BirA family biotin operon repressor/biotin-[acetyl-CoA-carboxylase] ligase
LLKLQPKTLFVGQNQVFLPNCHSTNDVAAEVAQAGGQYDGTVVYTDFQWAGRGQRGTAWFAASGLNLMMSVVLDSSFLLLQRQFDLSIGVALAARAALSAAGLEEAKIKWPNDLYVRDKKIGGILIENHLSGSKLQYSIVGLGMNVSQSDGLPERATSLALEGSLVDRDALWVLVCEHLEAELNLLKSGIDRRDYYLQHMLGFGERRTFEAGGVRFEGEIEGISPEGLLLLKSEHSKKKFDIKEISFCF